MPTPNERLIPHLVQRATFSDNPHRTGMDSILDFDYMGSSEYEWGAIGGSLKRIRADIGNYQLAPVLDPITQENVKNVFNQKLLLFCRNDVRDRIVPHIMELRAGKYRLKEPSYFEAQFDPKSIIPSIVQIKKTMTALGTVRGERSYRDGNMDIYRIDSKTKKVRGPNEYKLKINFWWDLGHDWFMFFESDGRVKKVLESVQPQIEVTSQG